MITSTLKRFAQSARRKLMDQIAAKIEYVLTADSAELREKAAQINELKKELNHTTRALLTERVAYTWFNRLAALRFMDANDYQPTGIRVISPAEGTILPQLLNEAKQGNIPADWKVNTQKVNNLLDGRIPASNPQNEAYRELLIAACNNLHTIFPFLFERINDYTELLLPDDLTSQFSIVHDVVEGMPGEDCKHVEVLGWLYQFYISEKKDEVFASKSKVKKEDIPAATQLFTPRWIVEYMVQNTVGKLWLQNKPTSKLRDHMPYYIESPDKAENTERSEFSPSGEKPEGKRGLYISSPEEITLLDQASGSGHILVYAFELLYKIYEEEGYNPSEIPALILEKNLWGFEIDERAAEIAGFALLMKAREYNRRVFRKGIEPHILTFTDWDPRFRTADFNYSKELLADLETLQQATNFGSLIQPKAAPAEIDTALQKVTEALPNAGLFDKEDLEQLLFALKQLQLLSKKFTCVVDNPPYMGGGKMNTVLADFVKKEYPDEKADLMVCFMQKAYLQLVENGLLGMINLPSWMFLSSFESYRKKMLKTNKIETLLQLGRGIFGSDFGTVAFTFRKTDSVNEKGVYRRLFKEHVQVRSVEKIQNHFLDKSFGYYNVSQNNFSKIPGSPIGYWLSDNDFSIFQNSKMLRKVASPRQGIATSDNNRFLRFWGEVAINQTYFDCKNSNDSINSSKKWYPYNKGGEYRKWFGNNLHVVNWFKDGKEIKNFKPSVIRNPKYFFKEGITWTSLTSGTFNARFSKIGFLFDSKGPVLFSEENNYKKLSNIYLLGLLNSKPVSSFLKILAPTLDFNQGPVGNLCLPNNFHESIIQNLSSNCLNNAIEDYNRNETSWDFDRNNLLKQVGSDKPITLDDAWQRFQKQWSEHFFELHQNEEELNQQFIEIYGLKEELTPDVPLEEITILQQELDRKALAKLNKHLQREPGTLKVLNYNEIKLPFDAKEIIAQFVSYAVGCMFGRYSLEKPGLILANQGETLDDYIAKVQSSEVKVQGGSEVSPHRGDGRGAGLSFLPDADNVIPILDDEWFEDDIVARFKSFLKASFGEENFDRNLRFVEECLGKDIQRYFARDFYTDHVRRYKKRPIYWMFSSPQGSFNALIYMHRYTPDTISLMLNNYLRAYQEKLRARRQHLERVQISGTTAEKTQALKETERIDKLLLELHSYERDILFPLATSRISINLDDGVLVNYNKFGKAIKEVTGLNDKPTKKKVREFDWIDVGEIRD